MDLDKIIRNIVQARNALGDLLDDARTATDGLISFEVVAGGALHAHLKQGVEMPPAIEKRCDIVTRSLQDGRVEWLKNRDNPLPEPTNSGELAQFARE